MADASSFNIPLVSTPIKKLSFLKAVDKSICLMAMLQKRQEIL